MRSIEKELNSVKYKAFGKVKIKRNKNISDQLEHLIAKKSNILSSKHLSPSDKDRQVDKIDEQIAIELKLKQKNEVDKDIKTAKIIVNCHKYKLEW